jgi:hypothetical protein
LVKTKNTKVSGPFIGNSFCTQFCLRFIQPRWNILPSLSYSNEGVLTWGAYSIVFVTAARDFRMEFTSRNEVLHDLISVQF